jgi:hypothetical protein
MKPARRMNVAQRDREDQAPRQQAGDGGPGFPAPARPATDHMVALVDRLEKGIEMPIRPGFLRCRHQHQRQSGSLQAALQCTPEAVIPHRDDTALDRPPQRSDQVRQGSNDAVGGFHR